MKTGGYYFCDHCNENAFGPVCKQCRRPSHFHFKEELRRIQPADLKRFAQVYAAIQPPQPA